MAKKPIGDIIKSLRLEHHMTQKQLADAMQISDKTVSKWERNIGFPDIALIPALSSLLDVDIQSLLLGDVTPNKQTNGNLKNTRYFVCPVCDSISLSTGNAEILCCGKRLAPANMVLAEGRDRLSIAKDGRQLYITSGHPMEKDHYISFVAIANSNHLQVFKQYPEWNLEIHTPRISHGLVIWHCTKHGVFYQLLSA